MLPPHDNSPSSETLTPDPAPVAPAGRREAETLGVGATPGTPNAAHAFAVPGYEILAELGRGGMGVVYQARQTALKRTVALKMILSGGYAGEADLERFRSEGAAIARLQHPNIVQIYEVGEHGGLPYFSLEFCAGGSLAARLNGTPLVPVEAARLVELLAQAIQVAHERGIVHRDLSPGNVLFDSAGTPKIADFGLAKKLDEATRTASGAIMGTPSYMAPEQASGKTKEVGPASDVYALGAILYECLTGRPPFKAATVTDTLLQVIAEEPVSPRILNAQVPRDVETICLKCLRKEPEKRYTSAAELAADLERFQRGEPIQARPVGQVERAVKWVQRNPVVTGAAVAVIVTLMLGTTVSTVKYLDAEQQRGFAEQQRQEAVTQRQEAQREADKAKKARDFLASIFDFSEMEQKQGTFSPFQLLDRAEQRVPQEFADHPELRADLLATLQEARHGLGAPAALLLEVDGAVELRPRKGAARPAARPAARNVLVYPGDRLNLAADANVRLVVLSDLHQEWLAPGHEATIGRQGCVPTEAVRKHSDDVMMTFARLPKGTFYMGWDGINKGVKTEIKEEFEIAVHAVTQGQWQAVTGNNPSAFSRRGSHQGNVSGISEEELKLFPVECVSWDEAQEFIKKLNEKEKGKGYLYRLPTEVEWEYACRNGATSEEECSYHFYFDKPTNDLSSTQANFNGEFPFGKGEKGPYLGRPTRVGTYPPNKLGLCDMHGNVWQWCADLYDPNSSDRVNRGGGWHIEGIICHAANRGRFAPAGRSFNLSVRLARVPLQGQDK